jgi:hypothetical protein
LVRHSVGPGDLTAVLPVGPGARIPGLTETLARTFGAPVHGLDDPESAVVRGAAAWLQRSGSRIVTAQVVAERTVPLSFAIPGGTATIIRWLVAPHEPYEPGTALARVRLSDGALWDLTARSGGTLDQCLVNDGGSVASGEWLALTRP